MAIRIVGSRIGSLRPLAMVAVLLLSSRTAVAQAVVADTPRVVERSLDVHSSMAPAALSRAAIKARPGDERDRSAQAGERVRRLAGSWVVVAVVALAVVILIVHDISR